jgi:hypothetical protein
MVSAIFGIGVPSAFAAPHFEGAAPGSVTCQVFVTVKFSPAMTSANVGSVGKTMVAKLKNCGASASGVTIKTSKFSGAAAFTNSVLNCGSAPTSSATTSLSVTWKGKFQGMVNGLAYSGKATFFPSTVSEAGEQLVTQLGTNHEGISLPMDTASTFVLGGSSFAAATNGMWGTLYGTYTAAQMSTMCAGSGIKKMLLAGTMTVG